MSTNYGRTTTSGNNFWVSNQGSNNQYGFLVQNVPAGVISALDVYMAGNGGTCRTILCLWDSSGNLLAQSAQFTAAAGSGGVNGQALQRATLTTPYRASTTADYYVGFWRNGSDGAEWSYQSGSGTIHPQAPSGGISNVGSPGALNLSNSTTGQMTAYLEWDPGNVYQGPNGGGAPAVVLGIYQGPNGGGAPIAVQGVYQGPNGGGAPVRIW